MAFPPPMPRASPAWRALTLALLSLAASVASAQTKETGSHLPFTVRIGGMSGVPVCLCIDDGQPAPRDRSLLTVAIGTEWMLAGNSVFQLSYAADLLPLVVSRNTADDGLAVWECGPGQYCGTTATEYPWRTSAVGAGVLPFGFVARGRLTSALALRARFSAGAVYMSRPVPVMQSRNFNFVAELGVGAELRVHPGLSVSAGLTHNHISNANTAPVNLGMDTRMLELGLVLGR